MLGLLTLEFGVAGAIADTTVEETNPYSVISDRNVFHLNEPPAPPAAEAKAAEVPKLLLSGFYKVGGKTRVLLSMPAKDAKAVTKYFNLAPGERDIPVEIVKINSEKGEVEIINSGTRMTLSLAKDGVVAMSGPSHPANGAPPIPGRREAHLARTVSPLAATAPLPPDGNGGDSGSLSTPGMGTAFGGANVPGRVSAGAGNSGVPPASGNGSRNDGVIITGGGSAGESATGVYVPPNPGSAAANVPGANVGEALANPQNSQYRTPPPPSGPQAE